MSILARTADATPIDGAVRRMSRPRPYARHVRLIPVAIAGTTMLVVAALTGCSSTHTCVDYISLDTPAAMAKEATIVVTGARIGTTDDVSIYGVQAHVHFVRIDSVLKGDAKIGTTLTVVSLPMTCNADGTYPHGDQLDVVGEAEFFVRDAGADDSNRVTTLTPDAGVVKIPDGGPLPWSP